MENASHTDKIDRDVLYRRLIDLPGGSRPALGASLPEVIILNDTTLQIEDTQIGLRGGKGVRLYIVNSLLMSTEVRTPSQLRDAYGFTGTTAGFSIAMQNLLQEIREATSAPLLRTENVTVPPSCRPRPGYLLQAAVVDKRTGHSAESRLILATAAKDNGQIGQEHDYVSFDLPSDRERVLSRMLGMLASHKLVEQGLNALLRGHIEGRSYKNRILKIRRYPAIEEETELELFRNIEEGISDFVRNSGKETPKVLSAVLSALRLYLHHEHLIRNYARSMSKNEYADPQDFPELYQQGAIGLLTAIGRTGLARREAYGLFTYTAGWYIRNEMVRWFNDTKGLFPLHPTQVQAIRNMQDAGDLLGAQGAEISKEALAEETGFSHAKILALLARTAQGVHLEDSLPGCDVTYGDMLDDVSFEEEFDHLMVREDIDMLFASPELNDREKIVLSLRYGVYSGRLAGAEMRARGKGIVFTYPYTEEDFDEICRRADGLRSMDALFGLHPGTTSAIHRKALQGARLVLVNSNYTT